VSEFTEGYRKALANAIHVLQMQKVQAWANLSPQEFASFGQLIDHAIEELGDLNVKDG